MVSTHAILADSTDQYAGIADGAHTGLDIAGSMSISAWLRPDAIGRINTICGKWLTSDLSYLFRILASDVLEFRYSTTGAATAGSVASLSLTANSNYAVGAWTHVGVVFRSGTPECQFYANGIRLGAPAAIAGVGTVFDGAADFRIANYDNGDASTGLEGRMDAFRIFDDERTDVEMWLDHWADPVAGDNLVAGYRLNNDFVDVVGNNNLTNSGLAFSTAEIPPIEFADLNILNAGGGLPDTIIRGAPTGLPEDIAGGFSVG